MHVRRKKCAILTQGFTNTTRNLLQGVDFNSKTWYTRNRKLWPLLGWCCFQRKIKQSLMDTTKNRIAQRILVLLLARDARVFSTELRLESEAALKFATFTTCSFLKGYAIQGKSITWLVNSTLNFTWKTDIALIASRFVRYRFFAWNLTWNSLVR